MVGDTPNTVVWRYIGDHRNRKHHQSSLVGIYYTKWLLILALVVVRSPTQRQITVCCKPKHHRNWLPLTRKPPIGESHTLQMHEPYWFVPPINNPKSATGICYLHIYCNAHWTNRSITVSNLKFGSLRTVSEWSMFQRMDTSTHQHLCTVLAYTIFHAPGCLTVAQAYGHTARAAYCLIRLPMLIFYVQESRVRRVTRYCTASHHRAKTYPPLPNFQNQHFQMRMGLNRNMGFMLHYR